MYTKFLYWYFFLSECGGTLSRVTIFLGFFSVQLYSCCTDDDDDDDIATTIS
jgi:hypothetical protein